MHAKERRVAEGLAVTNPLRTVSAPLRVRYWLRPQLAVQIGEMGAL
jgi:hypothetical protein